jgi:hypothetical protein
MSKNYKVDVWIQPAREWPAGAENSPREIKRELICSDDEKRAFAKEDDYWILFQIDSIKKNVNSRFDIECIDAGIASSEREALDFLVGLVTKQSPTLALSYTATNCTLD